MHHGRGSEWRLGAAAMSAGASVVALLGETTGEALYAVLYLLGVGAGCAVLLFAWWKRAAGSVAMAFTAVVGGVTWAMELAQPGVMPMSALALVCGGMLGGVGMRAFELGSRRVIAFAAAGSVGALLGLSFAPSAGIATTAAIVAVTMVLLRRPGEAPRPRLRDVAGTLAALASACLAAAAFWGFAGESWILIGALSIGAGAASWVGWRENYPDLGCGEHTLGILYIGVLIVASTGAILLISHECPSPFDVEVNALLFDC